MTTNTNRGLAASANLERIAIELTEARADLELLERLKSAADRVARLTAEREKAIKARDRAIAAEAKASEDARFAGISDLNVTEHPDTVGENVLRSSWTISYVRPSWNGYASVPTHRSSGGFGILPPEILDYLIERQPSRIPAKIMALAPDNPRDAFRYYFASLRRGFRVGPRD